MWPGRARMSVQISGEHFSNEMLGGVEYILVGGFSARGISCHGFVETPAVLNTAYRPLLSDAIRHPLPSSRPFLSIRRSRQACRVVQRLLLLKASVAIWVLYPAAEGSSPSLSNDSGSGKIGWSQGGLSSATGWTFVRFQKVSTMARHSALTALAMALAGLGPSVQPIPARRH